MKSPPHSPVGFGRTTTEKRFIAAFGAVVLVVGVAAYMTLAGLQELHAMMHRSVAAANALIQTHRLEAAVHGSYAHQAHTIILGNATHLDRYEKANQELAGRVDRSRAAANAPRTLVDRVDDARAAMDQAFRARLLPAVLSGDDATVQAEHAQLLHRIEALERELDAESTRVENQLASFEDHASTVAHAGFRNALIVLIALAAFTAIVGVALGRSVARPVALLHAGAKRIAEGDLDARLPVTGPLEFRALAEQFNHMVVATRENQARLLESEQLAGIGRLAAGVAHEINNPLGVIRGYAKLVRQRTEDATALADLQVIEDECARCHEIVRGLLDLARPPVDQAAPIGLRELVDEIIERMDQSAPERGARIEVSGDGTAWGNPRTVRQTLVNLLDNALQAGGDGAVTVEIGARGQLAEVSVTDNGEGLPPEGTERIFEPFFTTKSTGTGLGLAVSRAIARAHGGDLEASNVPGGGARFVLTLPSTAGGKAA